MRDNNLKTLRCNKGPVFSPPRRTILSKNMHYRLEQEKLLCNPIRNKARMTTAKPEKENGRPPIVIVGMVYAGIKNKTLSIGKNGKNNNDNIDIKIPSNDICNDDQLSISRAHEESSYPTPQEKLSKNIVFSNHVRKKLSRNSSTSSFTSYNMMKDSDNLISNARMFHSPRGLPNNSIGDSLLSGG